MSRNYVCGVIRDSLKRFLVIQHYLSNNRRMCTISAESWVGRDETAMDALALEFKTYLGISSLDIFEIKHTRTITSVSNTGVKNIHTVLLDIKKTCPFRFGDDIADATFITWDSILNSVNAGGMIPTVYTQNIVDRLYTFQEVY